MLDANHLSPRVQHKAIKIITINGCGSNCSMEQNPRALVHFTRGFKCAMYACGGGGGGRVGMATSTVVPHLFSHSAHCTWVCIHAQEI